MNPVAVIACVITVIWMLLAAWLVIAWLNRPRCKLTVWTTSCSRVRRWSERYIYCEVVTDHAKAGWWLTLDEVGKVSAAVRRGWRPASLLVDRIAAWVSESRWGWALGALAGSLFYIGSCCLGYH